MIRISYEICRNIAHLRKKAHLSQQAFADKLTQMIGENISLYMVSTWERGIAEPRIGFMPYICQALNCTSYDLYPHSTVFSDRDMRFLEAIQHLSDRQKDILLFMLTEWDGDADTFWEFGGLYASLAEYRRQNIARVGIDEYQEAKACNDGSIDPRISIDLNKIIRGWKALDK